MKNAMLFHKHLLLAMLGLAITGLAVNSPALAQRSKSQLAVEEIVVTATPLRHWQGVLTGTSFREAFAVSASLPVSYADLDLTKAADAAELDRRIDIAAVLVCKEIDIKYPPLQYPPLTGGDCLQSATNDGMAKAKTVIASAGK